MIAYSKMRVSGTKSKSRSMDFSDFSVFPEEPNSGNGSNLKSKAPQASHDTKSTTLDYYSINKNSSHDQEEYCCSSEQEHDDEGNRRVLCGSSSSTTASNRYLRFEMQKSMGIESAVRRAFSMRRSSSVSEWYCRIHDQSVTLTSEMDCEEDFERTPNGCPTKSGKKKKKQDKGGKILRACRRFFRL